MFIFELGGPGPPTKQFQATLHPPVDENALRLTVIIENMSERRTWIIINYVILLKSRTSETRMYQFVSSSFAVQSI